ncbi:MAG: hypothetical protein U1E87_01165 [Alphaproteobacteria bacterium]
MLVEKSSFGLGGAGGPPALAEGVGINTARLGAVAWIITGDDHRRGRHGLLNPLIQLDALDTPRCRWRPSAWLWWDGSVR